MLKKRILAIALTLSLPAMAGYTLPPGATTAPLQAKWNTMTQDVKANRERAKAFAAQEVMRTSLKRQRARLEARFHTGEKDQAMQQRVSDAMQSRAARTASIEHDLKAMRNEHQRQSAILQHRLAE